MNEYSRMFRKDMARLLKQYADLEALQSQAEYSNRAVEVEAVNTVICMIGRNIQGTVTHHFNALNDFGKTDKLGNPLKAVSQ